MESAVSGLVEWLKEHDLYHLGGAFFLLIVCFCAWATWRREAVPSAQGRDVSELRLVDPGGTVRRVGDLAGRVVVLDFWATWCPPCQKSLPHMEKVAKAVAGQNVAIHGVCVRDQRGAYDAWMLKHKGDFSFKFGYDPAGKSPANLATRYNVSGIPTTYIIDAKGLVAETIVGYDTGDTRVEDALRRLGVKL
jgi:thiol-disulfide isomerase/thioredoxin